MTVLHSGGALARGLVLLAALAGPALAQAPTESTWKSVGTTWVELCTAPCRVTNGSSFAARVAVGSTAPTSDDAAAAVLTSQDVTRDFGVAGLKVFARALSNSTRVVVEPVGGAGRTTSTGAAEPPTAPAGKLIDTAVTVPANASTQLVPANPARIGLEIQCDGTAIVGLDLKGGVLTGVASAPRRLPAVPLTLYTAPFAPLTAVTAYTAAAQVCWVAEWLR